MAKTKRKNTQLTSALEARTAPCLEINFTDPIFAVASHPTEPLVATGLGTGHVFMHRYDGEVLAARAQAQKEAYELADAGKAADKKTVTKSIYQSKKKWWGVYDGQTNADGDEAFGVAWKTRRHKGSCRAVVFEARSGSNLYTFGTDKIVKMADTLTGKVVHKLTPTLSVDGDQINRLVHSSTEHNLLVAGTEVGDVHVFDSRTLKDRFTIREVHEDAVNAMVQMSATSSYHFLSVGSTTLAHFDIRKGVITASDEQDDEIMSMCFPDVTNNGVVAAGMGEGVVTMWKKEKNNFMDQVTRVRVSKDNSIDCMISTMDQDDEGDAIWAGCSDGILHKVDVRRGKITECRVHGLEDEVVAMDLDYQYRLLSAGMENIKIWSNVNPGPVEDDPLAGEDDSLAGEDDSAVGDDGWSDMDSSEGEGDSDGEEPPVAGESGRTEGEGSDVDSSDMDPSAFDSDDPSDDSEPGTGSPVVFQRKRRTAEVFGGKQPKKKMIPLNRTAPVPEAEDEVQVAALTKKQKKKAQLSSKQLKNMQDHEHGIRKFDDL